MERYEIISLIEELGPNGLEFIQFSNNDEIHIEEVYLDKIIDSDNDSLSIEEYSDLINYFYSDGKVLFLIGNHLLIFSSKWSNKYSYEVHQDVFNMCIDSFDF